MCWEKVPRRSRPRSTNRDNAGVDTGIGATLREARTRRKLDLVEVEAAIKIRVRYLQAIENEEWGALPGSAYARGFVRTYAYYLGLDGERLADDYARSAAPSGERVPRRVEPVPSGARRSGSGPRTGIVAAAVCLALIAIVVAIALAGGGDESPSAPSSAVGGGGGDAKRQGRADGDARPRSGVALSLAATGEVWVCLLDAGGRPLVAGQILEEGAEAGPFHSTGYELALGNGSASLTVDGKPAAIPPSSSPVGYEIDSQGRLTALEEGERPSCE